MALDKTEVVDIGTTVVGVPFDSNAPNMVSRLKCSRYLCQHLEGLWQDDVGVELEVHPLAKLDGLAGDQHEASHVGAAV